MERAFAGASTVLLISGDTPNEVRIVQHERNRRGETPAPSASSTPASSPASPIRPSLTQRCIARPSVAARDSGMAFTIMRDSDFAETIMMVVERALNTGMVCHAAGQGRVAWCSRREFGASAGGSCDLGRT